MNFLKKLLPRRRLLFHICCAPCGAYVSRDRLAKNYALTWYFYNPNLCCREEYDRRLAAVKLVAEKYNFPLIIEPYDHTAWQEKMAGLENDPERGRRCINCYLDRLRQTAEFAKRKGFALFSTSLLVSPYKDSEAIREISKQLAAELGVGLQDQNFFR